MFDDWSQYTITVTAVGLMLWALRSYLRERTKLVTGATAVVTLDELSQTIAKFNENCGDRETSIRDDFQVHCEDHQASCSGLIRQEIETIKAEIVGELKVVSKNFELVKVNHVHVVGQLDTLDKNQRSMMEKIDLIGVVVKNIERNGGHKNG